MPVLQTPKSRLKDDKTPLKLPLSRTQSAGVVFSGDDKRWYAFGFAFTGPFIFNLPTLASQTGRA